VSEQSTTIIPALHFWSEEPSKYDYNPNPIGMTDERAQRLTELLQYPTIKIDTASAYVGQVLDAFLPILISEKEPRTVEFINYSRWKNWDNENQRLRGVIIRGGHDDVLLYVYGVGLDDNLLGSEVREVIFKHFGITPREQQQLLATAWGKLDYSVVFEVR
jgi:hypothetical protein